MTNVKIGYARVSTDKQDVFLQDAALHDMGVASCNIFRDEGISGGKRDRPGLALAIAATRAGDTLVVTRMDRLARSVPHAREIADTLKDKSVRLQIGSEVYDPNSPTGKVFFNLMATFAEFERDLIRERTREGMAKARAAGKLRGKQPKLKEAQRREVLRLYDADQKSIPELAELFSVSRQTIYRVIAARSAQSA